MGDDTGRSNVLGTRNENDPPLHFTTHVFFCGNRRPDGHSRGCCASKGAESLRDYMKVRVKELGVGQVRINASGCLDRCEHGPCAVFYPEGVWYTLATREAVDEVIQKHLIEGGRVPALMLDDD
jgi:(2Fe-2S) ferredoxin